MTRKGKIARLPRAVRDELNRRLQEGEPGVRLVEWLNGRDDVQAMLQAEFGGRPINDGNLSEWKQGGFEDWLRHQDSLEMAGHIMEGTEDYDEVTKNRVLADRVAEIATLTLARLLRASWRLEEGTEQREATLKIIHELVRLRGTDRGYEEALRERDHHKRYLAYNPLPAEARAGRER